jgi:2-succinyl-6-hydroxy-2,4-cyclohexadiene-1-carboxylate synthase
MLFSICQGQLDHSPICFLHGLLGSHKDFTEVYLPLSNNYYCIIMDLPGHGLSKPFNKHAKNPFEDVLDKLYRTLQAFDFTKFVLVGYSLGGRLASLFANKYPYMVKGLILLSCHFGLEEQEQQIRLCQDTKWSDLIKNESITSFLEKWYSQKIFVQFDYTPYIKQRSQNRPTEIAWALENLSVAKQPDLHDFYLSPPCPIMWLAGYADYKYLRLKKHMKKKYPKIFFDGIKNSSHAVHLENPWACAFKIRKFCEGL